MTTDLSLTAALSEYRETHNPESFNKLINQKYKLTEFKQLLQNILATLKEDDFLAIKEDILTIIITHCYNMKRVYHEYVLFLNALLVNKEKSEFVHECVKKNLTNYSPSQKEESFALIQLYVILATNMEEPYDKYVYISKSRDAFNINKEFPSREITFKYFSIIAELFLCSHNFICFLNAVYRMAQIEKCGVDSTLLEKATLICRYKNNRDYGFFGPLSILPAYEITEFFTKKNYEQNFEFKFDFKFYDLINSNIAENMIEEKQEKNDDFIRDIKKENIDINGVELLVCDGLIPFLNINNFLFEEKDDIVILKECIDVSIVKRSYNLKKSLQAKQKKNIHEIVVEKKILKEKPKLIAKVEKKKIKKKPKLDYFRQKYNTYKIYFHKLKEFVVDEEDIYYKIRKERYDNAFHKKEKENENFFNLVDQNMNLIEELAIEVEERYQKEGRNNNVNRGEVRRSTLQNEDKAREGEATGFRRRGCKLAEKNLTIGSNNYDRGDSRSSKFNMKEAKESSVFSNEQSFNEKKYVVTENNGNNDTEEIPKVKKGFVRGSKLSTFTENNSINRYPSQNSETVNVYNSTHENTDKIQENSTRIRVRGSKLNLMGENRTDGQQHNRYNRVRDLTSRDDKTPGEFRRNDSSYHDLGKKEKSESKIPSILENRNTLDGSYERKRGSKLAEMNRYNDKNETSSYNSMPNTKESDTRVRVRGSKLAQFSKNTTNVESKIKNLKIDDEKKNSWERTPKNN